MKRLLKICQMTWRRIRRKVRGQPDPAIYQERKEALEILVEEDKQDIIDLRYYDESGFCLGLNMDSRELSTLPLVRRTLLAPSTCSIWL